MKKLIILVCCLFFSTTLTVAQPETPDSQTFTPKLGDFSVETPISLTTIEFDPDGDHRRYWGSKGGVYLYVFVDKKGDANTSCDQAIRFARDHQKTSGSATVSGVDAEEYIFEDEDGFNHRVVSLDSNGYKYVFHAVAETSPDPIVDRFFSGIKIAKPVRDKKVEPVQNPLGPKGLGRASGPGNGAGSGSGGSGSGGGVVSGVGRGTGMPSGSGSGRGPAQDQNSGTAGVKILTKPRPMYTDLARLYNVSGFINLRITFLADGTIGSITPTAKLPFGLLGSAIAAAQSIRFEPARRDGVPYSKIMTVQYGFSIY